MNRKNIYLQYASLVFLWQLTSTHWFLLTDILVSHNKCFVWYFFLNINKLYIHVEKHCVQRFLLFHTQSVNVKIIYVHIKNNTLQIDNAFCLLPHLRVFFMFLSLMRNSIYISIHFYTYTKSEEIYLLVQTQFSVLVI